MKMSNPGLCCEKCFEMIARNSTGAAKLWLDLCELQLHSEVFGIKTQDFVTLRLLEVLGFIVTTDTPEVIVIKVKGQKLDGSEPYFCGGKCRPRGDGNVQEVPHL